jgi:phage I-like protein
VSGRTAKPVPAALGFRVKSGRAMAVLLAGPANAPNLIHCQAVLLSDPRIPQSKQPYHATLELPEGEAKRVIKKLRKVVADSAKESVCELLKQANAAGYEMVGTGVVVGSLVDPATLHNEHIRAHGLEGQLFRSVLEDALHERGIASQVLLEKNAYIVAARAVDRSPAAVKKIIAALGNSHEGSWRAEEKLAALAAWMAFCAHK